MDGKFYKELVQTYEEAEMVVIGVGIQLQNTNMETDRQLNGLIDFYSRLLAQKNYFMITAFEKDIFAGSSFDRKRVVHPLLINEEVPDNIERKQWDLYNKWLSATLNRRLLLVELGEGFRHPNLFRWPFEKINYINRKSKFYRVHDTFCQLPENICDRAVGVPVHAKTFLIECRAFLEEYC